MDDLANLELAIPYLCLRGSSLTQGEGSLTQGEGRLWFLTGGAQEVEPRELNLSLQGEVETLVKRGLHRAAGKLPSDLDQPSSGSRVLQPLRIPGIPVNKEPALPAGSRVLIQC